MTFATEAAKLGRIPVKFVDLTMDTCANVYGTAPCTAAGAAGGECFNTYGTCQDKPNYTAATKTYTFCEPNGSLPVGVQAFPLVKRLSLSPQTLTPGKGLGVRGSVTVRFSDMPHHDAGIDPYVATRSYDPMAQGTFWGKFRARNEFYEGRLLTIRTGYLGEGYDAANFQSRVYVIDSFKGPDKAGEVQIIAKDVFKLADDNRAQCPAPSTGRLSANMTAVATTLTLTPAGVGDIEYPTSGRIVINGEGMSFTRVALSDTLTITARDVYGAGAKAHSADDSVQLVKQYVAAEIQDVAYDLLTNFVPMFDPAWITKADWDTERDTFLPGVWTTDICEPVGVNTLLSELMEQGLCYLFWDEAAQQVRFRALRPPSAGIPVLEEGVDFNERTLTCSDDTSQRVSRLYVHYDRKDPTRKLDEVANYGQHYVSADLESEGANEYGSSRIKTIYSRWFRSTSQGRVDALAETLLKRYSKPPRLMDYEADMAQINILGLADRFVALTRQFQDATGANLPVNMQVLEQAQVEGKEGSTLRVRAQEYVWNERVNNSSSLTIIIPSDTNDLNLYDAFVGEYGTPASTQAVEFIVLPGVVIGSTSTAAEAVINPASWPVGITLSLINQGTISGTGGAGGNGGSTAGGATLAPTAGAAGGPALRADFAITIDNSAGVIQGGGGGGGGGSSDNAGSQGGGGGGGGAGRLAGAGGARADGGGGYSQPGAVGTLSAGGAGGAGYDPPGPDTGAAGGTGGAPGSAGAAGQTLTGGATGTGGAGGAAGAAVVGNSNITWTATGTRLGAIT